LPVIASTSALSSEAFFDFMDLVETVSGLKPNLMTGNFHVLLQRLA
jgi:hypothetical protein